MHYKSFAGLLLAAPALASPSYEYEEPSVPSLASGSVPPPYYDIPLSAIPVIASAIPSTWVEKMMDDPAARQAMIDAIESGAYPPWYYELPATIKLYASKVAVEQLYYFNQAPPTVVPSISTPIITPTSWWSVSPSPAVYTTTPARSSSTPLRTSSRTGSSTTSGSGSSTSSGSGSASSTVGGAPAATAGAATLAGAGIAALFGVALAL
ncbi:hypothetical protein N7474_001627 [Penicillium riverlandense]|uniref:uncharacterized protein n=1 Tax=Penicillium riverlandense TaxID=1903569 RepID=UPI0025475584|nr:uncharacterized protein N7474_001627 [Penicillium riverlandense]KAJ5833316.1 hypothetical protein N7474_001627 [Penicillium riverlandense]